MSSSRRATLATPPYPVTEDLHRSCHTLSGTAKTAGARQGIKIAEPLNRYVRKLYDNSIGMPAAGLAVLKDASAAIQQVVDHIDENTGFFLDHARIAARLGELEHELDDEISRLAETLDATMHSPALATAAIGRRRQWPKTTPRTRSSSWSRPTPTRSACSTGATTTSRPRLPMRTLTTRRRTTRRRR